jgi:anti-sigma regulatory factor (Ser/Thr protein kinase)
MEGSVATDAFFTVNDVLDVHHAHRLKVDGDRIAAAVGSAKHITLPALVEYECLRWMIPQLPTLPIAVQESLLGLAFKKVGSQIGLGKDRVPRSVLTDQKPRPCEFAAFLSVEDVDGDQAEFFKMRFWKSALHAGFAKSIANYLAAGLHEMMTNAVQHASSSVSLLAGYSVSQNSAQFSVADVGRGVLAALQQDGGFQEVRQHGEAIRLALQPGVSSDPSGTGGFGFNDIFQALAEQWGYMRFRSGEACLIADGTGLTSTSGELRPVPSLPGFQVSIACRSTAAPLDVPGF